MSHKIRIKDQPYQTNMSYFIVNLSNLSSSFVLHPSLCLSSNFIVPEEDELPDHQQCFPIPMGLIRVQILFLNPNPPRTFSDNMFVKNKLTCIFATFLRFDFAEEYSLSTQREMENCITFMFVAGTLYDGWRAGLLFQYVDEDDENELRGEIIEVTKTLAKAVLNQPGIENRQFMSKISRAMKAMRADDKIPDGLIRWYLEDETRGSFGRIDYRLGRVLTYAARLVVTANLY